MNTLSPLPVSHELWTQVALSPQASAGVGNKILTEVANQVQNNYGPSLGEVNELATEVLKIDELFSTIYEELGKIDSQKIKDVEGKLLPELQGSWGELRDVRTSP
jgi:hypothetical protein